MEESIICSQCESELAEQDIFCPNCGYPEKGDETEINKYHFRVKLKRDIVTDAEKKMKNVKILLYIIIGLNACLGLFYLFDEFTFADGIGNLIAALIFTGCLIWVNKNPLMGILAAFVFWILLQLSVIFVDPALIFQGILMKGVFLAIFIKGVNSAYDYKKYNAQLQEMNAN